MDIFHISPRKKIVEAIARRCSRRNVFQQIIVENTHILCKKTPSLVFFVSFIDFLGTTIDEHVMNSSSLVVCFLWSSLMFFGIFTQNLRPKKS